MHPQFSSKLNDHVGQSNTTLFGIHFCPSLLYVAVINTMTKANWREKGLFDFHTPKSSLN